MVDCPAQIEKQVREPSDTCDAAVTKAVNEAQAKQSAEFAKVLNATELVRAAAPIRSGHRSAGR